MNDNRKNGGSVLNTDSPAYETSKTRFYKLPARGLANKIWFFKNKKDQELKKNLKKTSFFI